jgi:acyl carrier protein
MATVEERVKAVVHRVLGVDPAKIRPQDRFTADLGAESVQSVELVAAFEEEFGLEMDEEQALSVHTVEGAVKFITQACREQGIPI